MFDPTCRMGLYIPPPPPPPPPNDRFILTIDRETAETIRALIWHICGSYNGPRGRLSKLGTALQTSGVKLPPWHGRMIASMSTAGGVRPTAVIQMPPDFSAIHTEDEKKAMKKASYKIGYSGNPEPIEEKKPFQTLAPRPHRTPHLQVKGCMEPCAACEALGFKWDQARQLMVKGA